MNKKFKLGVQLFSLRETAQADMAGILSRLAGFGYRGIEFAGLCGYRPADVKQMLDDNGLTVPSFHGPFPSKENIAETAHDAGVLGYTDLVAPFISREDWATKEAGDATLQRIARASELVNAHGLSLVIHNHSWEFDHRLDGKLPFELVMERIPRVRFQIDTYWVAAAGEDCAQAIERLAPRLHSLHIKDGPIEKATENSMVAVGSGAMKWEPILTALDTTGVEWIIVELDRCDTDPEVALQESAAFLKDNGYIE